MLVIPLKKCNFAAVKPIYHSVMSIADIKFKTKEDFVQFVKNAAKRKQEYIECRRNGATAEELKAKGFEALKVC